MNSMCCSSKTQYLCTGFFDPQLVASRIDELTHLLESMDKASSDDIQMTRTKLAGRGCFTEHIQTITGLWMTQYETERAPSFSYELPVRNLTQREVTVRIQKICEYIAENLQGSVIIFMHSDNVAQLLPTGQTFRRLSQASRVGIFFDDEDKVYEPRKTWWTFSVEGPELCFLLGGMEDTLMG